MESGWERRRKQYKRAMPKWADQRAIDLFYQMCSRLGYEADHIVPLIHPHVCGLHCEDNLRPLQSKLNNRKGNHYWEGMWNQQLNLFGNEEDYYVLQLSLF